MFGEADLAKALSDVGSKLNRRIAAYLIGGCATIFMGRKMATKDIDIVFCSTADAMDFSSAMKSAGFEYVHQPSAEYSALGAEVIMENRSGMRFDIFDRRVCRALELSEAMKSRARLYRTYAKLDVYLMSPEDIFLFKGITEREADLDDMLILAEAGIKWKTVEQECLAQKRSGRWAYLLGTKLMELREKFGISSPILKTLLDHADLDMLTVVFGSILGEANLTLAVQPRCLGQV